MLDEEDLDLIGEANPEWERKTQVKVSSLSYLQLVHQPAQPLCFLYLLRIELTRGSLDTLRPSSRG